MKNRTKAGRKVASLRKARNGRVQPTSPLKVDPTRTVTMRRLFIARVRRAFNNFKRHVVSLIAEQNYLALVLPEGSTKYQYFPVGNAASVYTFGSSTTKLRAFQWWMRAQLEHDIVGQSEREAWQSYVEEGFKKGAGRAFDDTKTLMPKGNTGSSKAKKGKGKSVGKGPPKSTPRPKTITGIPTPTVTPLTSPRPSLVPAPTTFTPIPGNFTTQSKEEFLRSAFGQPVAVEKAQLLAARTFDELEAVTEDMSNRMSRVLTDGLVQGKGPHEIARDIADEVDMSRGRAERVARTEIIRAHAEGQLIALEQMGVKEVGAKVEWATAGDSLVCPKCSKLEGKILTLSRAKGMLPLHPNCRCCWMPAFPDDDEFMNEGTEENDDINTDVDQTITADVEDTQDTSKTNEVEDTIDPDSFEIEIVDGEDASSPEPIKTTKRGKSKHKTKAKSKTKGKAKGKAKSSKKHTRKTTNNVLNIPHTYDNWVNKLAQFLPPT